MKFLYSRIHLILSCFVLCIGACIVVASPQQNVARFSAKTLRFAVERFLRSHLESTDSYTISESISDQVFDESGITARCDASTESLRGNTRIPIVFVKNESVVRRIYVPARITRMRMTPVITRSLRKGDILQESDVEEKLTDVTYQNGECASEYIGKRANYSLNKGTVLMSEHVVSGSGIQRGDVVTLNVTSGSVVIRTSGVALDDAIVGQTVRVRRQDSSIVLTGTAIENKTVTLSLSQL